LETSRRFMQQRYAQWGVTTIGEKPGGPRIPADPPDDGHIRRSDP
jgi:hypothetical protein